MTSNTRLETYKTLLRQYKNKARGKQKEKVMELLKLYKDGNIYNKGTIQRELNRFLGRSFKNEHERDVHYFTTMAKHLTNSRKLESSNKQLDKKFDKLDNIRLTRFVKSEDEIPNDKKALTYLNIKLNTKTAFKNMPTEDGIIIQKVFEGVPNPYTIYENIVERIRKIIQHRIKKVMEARQTVKLALSMRFTVFRTTINEDGTINYFEEKLHARTKNKQMTKASINDDTDYLLDDLDYKIDALIERTKGSGWRIKQFEILSIEIYQIKPARGSSYIPTPAPYNNSRCGLVNIQNNDLECFKWCMKYHQSNKQKHDDRTTVLSKLEDKYNYDGITYPVDYDGITKFENNNNVCIFVYYINENNNIIKERNGNVDYYNKDLIYLLRIQNEENSHFVYIKHISRLLNLSTHKGDDNKRFCPFCQSKFDLEKFDKHISSCYNVSKDGSILTMPSEGSKMKFKNYKNMLERPFLITWDSEATLVKTNDEHKTHKHVINSCCYHFTCTFDSSRNYLKTFVGNDCLINMIEELKELEIKCFEEMRKIEKMNLSYNDWKNFNNATTCYLCHECFDNSKALCKVRDHDHRTGKYRGATHAKCNINYFCNRYLPIVCHNLRGYDGHMIIKEAYKLGEKRISVIPNSNEKFMCFTIGHLKFIDSFQFLASSLDKLTENLYDKEDKYKNFHNTKKEFNDNLDLVCKKGFYPYEWFDNISKFNNEGLPSKEDFYSSLKQSRISDDDYKHACDVYEKMNCNNFLDYHLIYLKCDVLLLADIFDNFRRTTKEYYNLDPANYISAASLAWDAMLLKTKIELDLISDTTILDIIERSKRGGLCFVGSKRHVKANNRYIDNYDETKPEDYIIYLDANNLYGWAMVQNLPYKDIKYSNETTLEEVLKTPDEYEEDHDDDDKIGYILEVDLEYPEELHDLFKQYPPCPENVSPNFKWFSEFQKNLYNKVQNNKIKNEKEKTHKYNGGNKLIPHLFKHEKYCIHYRNLKFIHNLGVKISKVHNIISFKQKEWLKPYIDFNTEKRTKAKNEFEKDFFKLMNNSVFGKTMENVKNRMKLHLTIDNDNAIKWFSKPTLKGAKEIDGLYLIEMYNDEIEMDKPIYVGTSILDLSKLCMMEFHYNVIEKEFTNKYDLLYSDTDSLVYRLEHPDIYEWMLKNKSYFDMSENIPPHLKYNTNSKVLGKFKDEMKGLIIKESIALVPKVYSIIHQEYNKETKESYWKNKKTLKGVSKAVVKNDIEHKDYVDVISTDEVLIKQVVSLRSFDHQIYTYKAPKIALSSFYDKMCMLNANDCVPFGYMA